VAAALGRVTAGAGSAPSKVRKEKSMAEIRRLIAEGYSQNEIFEQLKHDWQLLKQENNAAALALEISILKDTFRATVRTLDEIATSPKTTVRQKIAAMDAKCCTAVAILQLQYKGPLIMNKILKDIDRLGILRSPFAHKKWNWNSMGADAIKV
jgi:hypothetical protein